jgi:hypothetical protein
MIYLDRPIYHNGIMVLPDYNSPRQFYFLPPVPRLVDDPQTGKKAFKIIKLVGGLTDPADKPGEISTGVAFFDCDLRLKDEEQEELKDAIRQQLGIFQEITLSPLLYKDGEVTCYVLGEKDWDTSVKSGTPSNIFVERLAGFGKPSLYGDNRATFSARMTQEGVTALAESFAAGGVIGISIVYTLKFDGLHPAFNFKVTANWEQIYHFLQETFKFDLFFYSVEDTSIVEKLEQAQLLKFEEVVIDPAASSEIKDLRKQMQQYILEQFFKPVLSVGSPAYGKVAGMVADIARALVVVPSFGYKRVEMTQEERKALSFEVTRVSAIERVIYPQAHLTALVPGNELPGYIQEINTDQDLFFRQLNVRCSVGGCDFAKQKIAWTHPYIKYGSPPEEGTDKIFENTTDKMEFTTWLQPARGFTYRTGYDVEFTAPDETDPGTIYGQETSFTGPEKSGTDRELVINPMEHFELHTVEFGLMQGFRTDKYPVVEVHIKYEDSDGYAVNSDLLLKGADGGSKCQFRVRTRRGVTAQTWYRLIYHQTSGEQLVWPRDAPWAMVEGSCVLIEDPFPNVFNISVRVAARADELDWADIYLRYQNPLAVGSYQEQAFYFGGPDLADPTKARQVWLFRTEDPSQQRYEYSFTLTYKDGTLLQSPGWIDSEARTLVVGRQAGIDRTIKVFPEGPSFSSEDLRDIKINLSHTEPDLAAPQEQELVFENETQGGTFTYRINNSVNVGYDYKIRYRWQNGQIKRVEGSVPNGALDFTIPTHVG